jgi:hypothetical protein
MARTGRCAAVDLTSQKEDGDDVDPWTLVDLDGDDDDFADAIAAAEGPPPTTITPAAPSPGSGAKVDSPVEAAGGARMSVSFADVTTVAALPVAASPTEADVGVLVDMAPAAGRTCVRAPRGGRRRV